MQIPSQADTEVVERKGLGHPDTLSDGLAEAISIAYSKYTLDRFGAVLHHNTDKLGIRGGRWSRGFGVPQMEHPIKVLLGGRMSTAFGSEEIPIFDIQEQTCRQYLNAIVPGLRQANTVTFDRGTNDHSAFSTWYRPRGLSDVPDHTRRWANDTSLAVAFSSRTLTEEVTLHLERHFYLAPFIPRYDFTGTDIKVMAVRTGDLLTATLCVPIMANRVHSHDEYLQKRLFLQDVLTEETRKLVQDRYRCRVLVNTQDDSPVRKTSYLTTLGTCIEFGEEGFVGRGNSHSGLITSNRPYSMEACFGKNPVYHVGKVGAFFAQTIAHRLEAELQMNCYVMIQANNGDELLRPSNVIVGVYGNEQQNQRQIEGVVEDTLDGVDYVSKILDGHFLPRSW